MFEKDYIMREVQKLVQILKVILGLKQEKKYDEALTEINNSYTRFFDEDTKTIQSQNVEGLVNLCIKDDEFSPDLGFALADLIKEEAEILEQKGEKKKAMEKYQLALELYKRARNDNEAAVPLNFINTMQELENKLNGD